MKTNLDRHLEYQEWLKKRFNRHFKIGDKVQWRPNTSEDFKTYTVKTTPFMDFGNARVLFKEIDTYCGIDTPFIKYPPIKVLKLTLNKIWFDLILQQKKTEEYREIKPYWISRLIQKKYRKQAKYNQLELSKNISDWVIKYDAVEFKNGYRKDARTMIFEVNEITIGYPTKIGALEFTDTKEPIEAFIIKLGRQLSNSNC